ncbi:MAG: methyltransferase domain-containing protein [Planctomycetota bacterium]
MSESIRTPRLAEVPCPLCGKTDTTIRWKGRDRLMGVPGEYQVVQCKNCSFLYQSPRPHDEDIFLIYPPDYPAYHPAEVEGHKLLRGDGVKAAANRYILSHSLGYKHLADERVSLLTKVAAFFRKPKVNKLVFPWTGKGRMLDVGCSSGARMSSMKALGWTVAGIEFSEDVANVAKRDHENVFFGDILAAPFADRSFDLVTCFHVLEHVTNPKDVMKRMVRWLAPGGMLVIELPNAASAGAARYGTHWFLLDLPRHFHHFTPETLTKLAEDSGGRMVRVEHRDSLGTWIGSIQFRDADRAGEAAPASKLDSKARKKRKSLKRILRPFALYERLRRRGEIIRAFISADAPK